ncbi:hypothetical protein [Halobaculum litoreum]|uniref:hypothetical protein n=1 Tax=Halobaculum litoreum TaxID=3031998 RepID=UPI0024C2BC55|nr:hypothetical protein [Halobaculum sp. DT92]
MSRYLRATLSAPGVRAGAAGGLVTAASALVGYVLVPTLDAGGALRDGWWLGFETLLAGDPAYAAGVLFVPAAVTTCLGVGAARRRGASRRRAALAVGGGTVAVAALAALATFLSGVLFVAVTVALAAGTTVEGVLAFLTVAVFGVAFFGVFGVVATVVVAALVAAGCASGCVLAFGVERARRVARRS